ncbi:MAG TPA: TolC family protein [Bacteroidaceae bacterium]|mgnify:CR=1 FL=1|nr:TolC family protein [Bacteroidaceae bacterium]
MKYISLFTIGLLSFGLCATQPIMAQEAPQVSASDDGVPAGAWSLRQCIDYALAHNITLKSREVDTKLSKVDVHTKKWARLPNLNGSASHNYSWGRSVSAVDNSYTTMRSENTSFGVSTNVPLFTGGRICNQYKLAKINLEASLADLEKAQDDISVQIAQQYLQVLYNQELYKVSQQQLALSKEQYERFNTLYKVGKVAQSNVSESAARVAQDEYSMAQASNNVHLALLELSQLLELPSPDNLQLDVPSNIPVGADVDLPSIDVVYINALASRPEVRASQLRVKGSEHSIRIAKSALLPSLSLGANLSTSYNKIKGLEARTFNQQMDDNFSQSIGVSMSVPIFNRFETYNNIKSTRLQREQYKLELEAQKKALYKEIQQSWYNAVAAQVQYRSAKKAVLANQEAFDVMNKKFMQGQANSVEFNESKLNLMKSISEQLQAKYTYLFRTKILRFYNGQRLE